jgi:predicted glutamine amidotransferase
VGFYFCSQRLHHNTEILFCEWFTASPSSFQMQVPPLERIPMCRWLAYLGPPIEIANLVLRPKQSLVRQSLSANLGVTPVNGDGFGLAWWGDRAEPGVFRDTLPAWNDANLKSLTEQISSRLFFAHVRASTGTATSRSNCHPFAYGEWAFMHNGQIGGWASIRRAIEARIPDELYSHRQGTTDTEALFLLAIAQGILEESVDGMARALGIVRGLMQEANIERPFRMSAALSNGKTIAAYRWSSDGNSPSLYTACDATISAYTCDVEIPENATVILSEPLDDVESDWKAIDDGQVLIASQGGRASFPLSPTT